MSMSPVAFSAPDGGYGWMIVFSSFFIHFMCNGLTLAMGVLCVSWYQEFNSTKTETSWVVSVNVAVMLAMGPFASGLAGRIGYRAMAVTGACFITVGSLLSSMASSILVLMLTIGVIGGIGAGMCYLPAVAVPAFYFEKRRSLAMGLGTAGIGGGMFLLAPVINWLILYYGWRGTMVILAGFSFNLCVAGALLRPLDAMRLPRAQSISFRYPNSEATSDTESLVQSFTENDPMRELKLKLGRITLESNSDSDLTSDQSSQEVTKGESGSKNSGVNNSCSSTGSHTMGSDPVFSFSTEVTVCENDRDSPKVPAIRIDPFPAIDTPMFESDKGSKKSSVGSVQSRDKELKTDNRKTEDSQDIITDSKDSRVKLSSNVKESLVKSVEHVAEESNPCSCVEDNLCDSSKTNTEGALKPKVGLEVNLDTQNATGVSPRGISDNSERPIMFRKLALNNEQNVPGVMSSKNSSHSSRQVGDTQLQHKPGVTERNTKMSKKSKHLEKMLQPTTDSALSLTNNEAPCCRCGYLQAPQSSSHSIVSTHSVDQENLTVNRIPHPILSKNHRHIFEPSQNHHSSFPGNLTIPNQVDPRNSAGNVADNHTNNNNFIANGSMANLKPIQYTHQKTSSPFPSTTAAQVTAANHIQDMSASLHSMASLGVKPSLAPNIFLNDMPMGGSLTVLESEATLPLTAYTDVEACKQFRSLLGLDMDLVYQKPNQKSSSSFLNPKDVRATGSILTLMMLDRSLSQSKRALSRGSHEYFRSRQTLYGSYRDSFRSRNGSFVRHKGKLPVSLTNRIKSVILGQLRLLQDTTFLLFALSNFLANLSIVMPAVFMVDRAVSLGLGSGFASLLVSLNGAGTIGGRVAIAAIADHPRMNRLVAYMAVLVLAGAITCISPICGTSMLLHGIYACGFGILIGNYGALCPCVMVDLKGLDAVGESYGMLLMFMGVSNLMGAPLGGILYDLCGSFSPPFVLHGLFLVGSGLIVLPLLCKQAKK